LQIHPRYSAIFQINLSLLKWNHQRKFFHFREKQQFREKLRNFVLRRFLIMHIFLRKYEISAVITGFPFIFEHFNGNVLIFVSLRKLISRKAKIRQRTF
jgi:hypothetical protein